MKKLIIIPAYCVFACTFIPFIISFFLTPNPTSTSSDAVPQSVTVFNHLTNTTLTMSLEDYLIGVVSAEMPAAFEDEALKAQAVAARTYTFYKAASADHEADVCTDPAHCQAYYTPEKMQENWGDGYTQYYTKIQSAVYDTQGEILTYNDEPIMAVFHSMGGGKTENAQDVWGTNVPYLVSVESPGEDSAVNYHSTLVVPFDEFKTTIKTAFPNATVNSFLDISQPVLTDGGHVKSVIIGSVTVPGTTLRTLFNLRSTKFTLSFDSNNVIFSVTGYGHGVGMSQYGANAMAKEGKSYREILSHYYKGAIITE